MKSETADLLEALYACSAELHRAFQLITADDLESVEMRDRLRLCAREITNAIGKVVIQRHASTESVS